MNDPLYGFEPRTMYLRCEGVTRNQAKAQVSWEEGLAYTDLRCQRRWLVYREVPEDEASLIWLDDWHPGYQAWMECDSTTEGAVAFWEITWPLGVS